MIALGLLLLPMFSQEVHGHGAVTNPVPRLLDSQPYCAWCVGEHVAANPPGQAHKDARLSHPCMGTQPLDGPYPVNHWGNYQPLVGEPSMQTYAPGSSINATIILDADHNGEAVWQYCPHSEEQSEECFWQHPLVDWTDVHAYWTDVPSSIEHQRSKQHYPQTVPLPNDMPTGLATLRWLWVCKNTDELFTSCIDVNIVSSGPTPPPTSPYPTPYPVPPPPTPPTLAPTSGPTNSCPSPGNGLPDWAATCGCSWTDNGNNCGPYTDDGSECFCQCCCAHSGKCAYAGQGGNSGSGPSCLMPVGIDDDAADKDNTNFVGCHGKLRVEGVQLVDEHGRAVQLMGMSSHGLHWFPDCYSKESIQYLVEHWGINMFRAAMYVGEGGYAQQPGLKDTVKNVVQWCKELGIYVIIDWHVLTPGDPNADTYSGAIPFFEDMAQSYKDEKHVLFEICNEPNGVDWSTVKMYADSVISAIRQIDSNTVIIVGTPTWSQDIHEARADPVSMPSNVMYAFHFYAGTHMSLMTRVQEEAKLIPIFASEWGTSQASGDGGPYLEDAKSFLDVFNDASGQKISWAQWSYADKSETSAALASGACASQAWDDTSCSGTFLKNYIKMHAETCSAPPTAGPTTSPTVPPTPTPPSCSDTPTPSMFDSGYSCDNSGNVQSCKKCANNQWWRENRWCRYSCYQAGCGYADDVCERHLPPPTAAPTVAPTRSPSSAPTGSPTATPTAQPTQEPTVDPTHDPTVSPTPVPPACQDTPTPSMADNGYSCDNSDNVQSCKKCANNQWWRDNRWCRYSCYQAGCGYADEICERLLPPPSASPTPAPTLLPTTGTPTEAPTVPPTPPTPSPTTPSSSGSCRNPDCGCPPFSSGKDWCTEQNSLYSADCQISEAKCLTCGTAVWCPGRRMMALLI